MKDISSKTMSDITELLAKPCEDSIDTAIVVPNSSISTSSNFISDLDLHLQKRHKNFKTIFLNSKESTTMRHTLKAIIDGVTKEKSSSSKMRKITDENLDTVYDLDSDIDEEENGATYDRRLPYDLDIVEEWCKNQNNAEKGDVRVIIIFEDIDSYNLSLLSRLLKLCYSFVGKIPFKFVFNLGTTLKSLIKKLDTESTHFLRFTHFKLEQTDTVINKIVNEVIIHEDYLLGEELTRFILDRFTNSIKSVDEFLKILKIAKMTFFYSNPLSIIASKLFNKDRDLNLTPVYTKALRILPSFRNHINSMVEKGLSNSKEIQSLLTDDAALIDLLKESFRTHSTNASHFKSVYKLSTEILSRKAFKREKNFLEIYYKLSSRDEFVRIQFLNELISKLKENINTLPELKGILKEISQNSENDDLSQSLNSKLKLNVNFDELEKLSSQGNKASEHLALQFKVEFRKLKDAFFQSLDEFLKKNIKGDYRIATFNELYQFNDIKVIRNLLVPEYRDTIEEAAISHEVYLGDSNTGHFAIDRLNNTIDPILTILYQIYRETTLHLNIFDFYTAFKYSLNRDQVMKDLNDILDDENQVFESFLDDQKRFHFIYQFFNDVDISDDEKWDKITLALFLQKAGEMINSGFFRFLSKKKVAALEKASWKGL
jgi:origin recognition complex subunit 3